MKYAVPVILTGATITVAITTALAGASGAFSGRTSLIPYLIGYGVAAVLLVTAAVMAILTSSREGGKPRIVPIRYGSSREKPGAAYYGLVIVNEGEPAYDLSIPKSGRVPIGAARLMFRSGVTRLTKEQGEALVEAWIELDPHNIVGGSGLFDQMRKAEIASVIVKVMYKDADNRWYLSDCRIERDVLATAGLTTRFVRQRRISRLRKRLDETFHSPAAPKPGVSQARGGKELHDVTLVDGARSLGDEILDFLNQIGPRPQPHINDSMTAEEILGAGSEEIGAWVDRVHHTYFAQFRNRVDAIVHQLAAEGVSDPELNSALIDPQVQTGDKLRTIAEKLIQLSAKLPRS